MCFEPRYTVSAARILIYLVICFLFRPTDGSTGGRTLARNHVGEGKGTWTAGEAHGYWAPPEAAPPQSTLTLALPREILSKSSSASERDCSGSCSKCLVTHQQCFVPPGVSCRSWSLSQTVPGSLLETGDLGLNLCLQESFALQRTQW